MNLYYHEIENSIYISWRFYIIMFFMMISKTLIYMTQSVVHAVNFLKCLNNLLKYIL